MEILILFITTFLFSQVDTAWIRRYNGLENIDDYAVALTVDNNGNIYVTGMSDVDLEKGDWVTIKYDQNGNKLWIARYEGSAKNFDSPSAIAVDNNGNIYVTGFSLENNGNNYATSTYTTIKHNSNGNYEWIRYYAEGWSYALAVDSNGNAYVTGQCYAGISYDYATIKYNPQGDIEWIRRYNGPANEADNAEAIAVDIYGNVYVTGTSWGSRTRWDYVTIKYDANGNPLWIRRYNGPENKDDFASKIAVDNEGNVYVTGKSLTSGGGFDFITIKYDENGNELWIRRYNGPAYGNDIPSGIGVDNFGNIYLTGYSYDPITDYDYVIIKYDANGNLLWVRRYNGPGNGDDRACALAIDNNSDVYVTGSSWGLYTKYDYATIKYDAQGNLLWVVRYDGPANDRDEASSLFVDNFGNVYVTGSSYGGEETFYDYTTIKYIQQSPIKEEKIEKSICEKTKKIYDISGKLVKDKKLKKGIYFLKTEKENKKIIILK